MGARPLRFGFCNGLRNVSCTLGGIITHGDAKGLSSRNALEKMMTAADIATAQKLAREWKPKKKGKQAIRTQSLSQLHAELVGSPAEGLLAQSLIRIPFHDGEGPAEGEVSVIEAWRSDPGNT